MKRLGWMWTVIALVVLAYFGIAYAFPSSNETPVVSSGVEETVDQQHQTATYTFTVDPKDSTVKDIHIVPPKGKVFPQPAKDPQGDPVVTMPQDWIFYRPSSGRSYNFFSGKNGAAIPPGNSTFSVTIPIKNSIPPGLTNTTFTFTSDGDSNIKTGFISATTRNVDGNDLYEPIKKLAVWLGPNSRNEAGGFLLINSRTELFGLAYQLYCSKSLAANQGEDSLGIGLDLSDVPPDSWITSIKGRRGAFHIVGDEGLAQTKVNLGDDPDMEGAHLYFVVALDLDNDGIPDVYNTPPLDVVLFQQ